MRPVVLPEAGAILEDHAVADPDVLVQDRVLEDAALADAEPKARALVAGRAEDAARLEARAAADGARAKP